MKRLCFAAIFAILCAGGECSNLIRETTLNEGASFIVSVSAGGHSVTKCHLESPNDGVIDFAPGDQSRTTDKYSIDEGIPGVADCMLIIHNIDANDEGIWKLSYDHDGEEASRVQLYNITVNIADVEESIEEDDVTLLSEIYHHVNMESVIDISLNKESFEEECYVRPPGGEMTLEKQFTMENVTVQSRSKYVSCRITLGPINEEMLGEWRLCGKSVITEEMRCQPANITWNNNNAIANWHSINRTMFEHPVNYGSSVNPGVAGTGNIITCHVVTPSGEDLVLTKDVKYPHLERIEFNRASLCSVAFTDIDSDMIGHWIIYGKFRSATSGLNEIRLPLNFFLYNENDPYEQAYNVTTLPVIRRIINLGTTVNEEVGSAGQVNDCQFRTPSGVVYNLNSSQVADGVSFKRSDTTPTCKISISPVTEQFLGEWQIVGKFSSENQFTERRQTFNIIQEDPANPIIDEDRTIENMTEMILNSEIGTTERVTINSATFVQHESCHILTPSGLQYSFIDGFDVPNVEIINGTGVDCGVNINVQLSTIGNWTLILRASRLSVPIERRQPFTIRVEETFSLGNPVTVTEGTNLYIRLPERTDFYETCKLYGPDGEEFINSEVDPAYEESCGYIVRSISRTQNGTWQIVYGNQITYRGSLEVNVLESIQVSVETLSWKLGSAIDITHGPENAVYCQVKNPSEEIVFDGFGPCKIVIDRVMQNHQGSWWMNVALPGAIMTSEQSFVVNVTESDSGPIVTTTVVNAPTVLLTCSVPTEYQVHACKFRDPYGNGRILVASQAAGQEGNTIDGNYESNITSNSCTLRLISPTTADLGLWRCGVDTNDGTHYGFITVTYPWLMQDASIAANVVTEPVLKSRMNNYNITEGDIAQMSCSLNAAIRYCYFRARNGTTFSVGPAISSSDYEYVGNGFDAGECGVRFKGLQVNDTGIWSCHVGLLNATAPEQRANFEITVQVRMAVAHYWMGSTLAVRSRVYHASLDYCRFVRIDGTGFTAQNAPAGYHVDDMNKEGICSLKIDNATILDRHPWTIIAKVSGQDGEISKMTTEDLLSPLTPATGPQEGMSATSAIFLWIFVTFLGILLISAGVALIPKNNREWTYTRAARVRDSFRRSNNSLPQKQPLPNDNPVIITRQKV